MSTSSAVDNPSPVFIIGCGRSGTTALGRTLGSHPAITYVNEPRGLWQKDPRTNVWNKQADSTGSIDLYADDAGPETSAVLRKAFGKRTQPGTLLLEKTPINSFRVDYIRAVFPGARFLHLLRNGLDVAASIVRRTETTGKTWYGTGDSKWRLLSNYAARHGSGHLTEWAGTDLRSRGLVEWRLAVSHARPRLDARDLEIRYEDLVGDPTTTLTAVLTWMGLSPDPVDPSSLEARSEPIRELDEDAAEVVGDLLRELGYAAAPVD